MPSPAVPARCAARSPICASSWRPASFGTPEGPLADELYNDAARDLLDTIEGWQDDLDGVFVEVIAEAS
jgi:hypothetical protein